jgi:hypothetical protein
MQGWFTVDEYHITWQKARNKYRCNDDIKCLGTQFITATCDRKYTYCPDLEITVQTAITLITFTNNTSHVKKPNSWRNDGNFFLCNIQAATWKSTHCTWATEYNTVSNYMLYPYCKMAYSNVHFLTSVTVKLEETHSKTFLRFMIYNLHYQFIVNFNTTRSTV